MLFSPISKVGASAISGEPTSGVCGLPISPFHHPEIACPAEPNAPETEASRAGAPCPTPSPSVVIMRVPDSVSCDSGPVCASEKGRYSRTLANAFSTVPTSEDILLLMPSMNVSSNFAPDSKRSRSEKNSVTSFHISDRAVEIRCPSPETEETRESQDSCAPSTMLSQSTSSPDHSVWPTEITQSTMDCQTNVIFPQILSHIGPIMLPTYSQTSSHFSQIKSQF